MRRLTLALLSSCLAAAPPTVHVTVDFAAPADYPLSKSKFGVFNSGMVRPDRYARDMPLYDEVRPDSLRVDLGWGARWIGWKTRPIAGTADHLTYDFSETDRVATLLRDHGVPAYWSYCYTPTPLQPRRGNYQGIPTDEKAWASVLRTMAAHYRTFPGGNPVGYHEVGNEPDNRDFFTGDLPAYQRLYQLGSQAIRDGDPDAVVGGPALAFSSDWVDPFLDRVVKDKSPLDFYSFHWYPGVPYKSPDLDGVLRQMRDALAKRPELRTAEAHLNEWNPYKIDYPRGGRQDRHPMAAAFLHDVKRFLAEPWLTRVYFAQFQDSGGGNFSGMIDIDGKRKPSFVAYAMYQSMAVDRYTLTSDDADVEGLASKGYPVAWTLLWNRSAESKRVDVNLRGWVGARAVVNRIDARHDRWQSPIGGPTTTAVETDWNGELPAHGVVLLASVPVRGEDDRQPPISPTGRIVRELHDFPNRASPSYADFDRRTWTARLGSGGEDHTTARVGVTADGLDGDLTLTARVTGQPRRSGVVGARIDYQSRGGVYTRSVLFRCDGGDAAANDTPPWGTARPADSIIRVRDNDAATLNELLIDQPTFSRTPVVQAPINLRRNAPPDWTGRVQVSFVLADAGPDVRATFRLTGH